MTSAEPTVFRVQHVDHEHDVRVEIGTVSVDARGAMTVLTTQPKMAHYLGDIVARVNARPVWNIKVPPPPGARPFGVHLLAVQRTSPRLLERLRQYLEQQHDLLLVEGGETAPLKDRLRAAAVAAKAASPATAAAIGERLRKALEACNAGDLAGAERLLGEAQHLLGN